MTFSYCQLYRFFVILWQRKRCNKWRERYIWDNGHYLSQIFDKTTKSLSVDNGLLLPSFLWIWEDKTKINQIKSSVDDFVIKEDSVQRLPFTPSLFNYPKSESFIVIDWKLSIESLALVSSQPAQHWSVLLPKIISFQ